jgi:hypothetical protein
MTTEMRRTGLDVVGDMPWGTLFCLCYETKADLLDQDHGIRMGLPISRSIIESHGGRLWATGNAGRPRSAIGPSGA